MQQRYEWLYVCGFVRPTTGETVWWLLSTVTAALFGQVLAAFAQEVGAGAAKRILLVLDGAGWHTGEEVQVPDGIHLVFLPSAMSASSCQRRASTRVGACRARWLSSGVGRCGWRWVLRVMLQHTTPALPHADSV